MPGSPAAAVFREEWVQLGFLSINQNQKPEREGEILFSFHSLEALEVTNEWLQGLSQVLPKEIVFLYVALSPTGPAPPASQACQTQNLSPLPTETKSESLSEEHP